MSCLLCQSTPTCGNLCLACRSRIPSAPQGCLTCGEILDCNNQCQDCLRHEPAFTKVVSGCHYAWPVDWLIQRVKFDGMLTALETLNERLITNLRDSYTESSFPQAIVPMPLHFERLNERGFNQSALVAQELASKLALPIQQSLIKTRNTDKQSTLNATLRQRNLRGSFSANAIESGAYLAVVDDVMTTGATANEAARCLIDAGAARVDIWLLARATRPPPQYHN